MDALVAPPQETEFRNVHRCARCGVESAESTCFVFPERYDKSPRDIRCITCEQRRVATGAVEGAIGLVRTIFLPVLLLVGIQRGLGDLTVPILLAACFMAPVSIVAHELGHAIAARLVGLEVGAIVIGVGPKLWRGELFGTAVTLHAWPLSGLTFLGAGSFELLRIRLWFATLMGPATNVLLVFGTTAFWPELVGTFGVPLLSLWIITNALLALSSLVPRRFSHAGAMLSTDGLALLQIPRNTPEQLESYLFTAPLLRAMARFENRDYRGAHAICAKALERVPDNMQLRVLVTACRVSLHDYAGSLAILKTMMRQQAKAEAAVRAVVENNMAFAALMSNPHAGYDHESLIEADHLSADAFALFPCTLAYRSTRALILAATGRPDQALELLAYSHYDEADCVPRGHRETARAFALHALGRPEESRRAAAEAVRLNPENVGVLKALGVAVPMPVITATPIGSHRTG